MTEAEITLLQTRLDETIKERENLKAMTRSMSGSLAAFKQTVDELMSVNVNVRGSHLLLEDDIRNLKAENKALKDFSLSLNDQKTALQTELDELKARVNNPIDPTNPAAPQETPDADKPPVVKEPANPDEIENPEDPGSPAINDSVAA